MMKKATNYTILGMALMTLGITLFESRIIIKFAILAIALILTFFGTVLSLKEGRTGN